MEVNGISRMMVPLALPSLTDKERGYINEILVNGDVGQGRFVEKFEKAWARKNKKKYGVSVNNGTNALFLALRALGIGAGDFVIVPEFTMIATAWAVSYTGAQPIFVDCDDTLNMDPKIVQFMVDTFKPKAIIPVHIYGRKCSDEIYRIARRNNMFIVEDMAEAHGIQPKGDISCYSFYGNKIITTGEGGMCLTNNKGWADKISLLRNMAFDKERSMLHLSFAYNMRLTNLQAAIGLAQVERFDEILAKRKWIEETYDKYLPKKFKMPKRSVLWQYDIMTPDPEKVKRKLKRHGVDSRYFFKPMSAQPMYKAETSHLRAEYWSKNGLYLPVFFDMVEGDIKHICKALEGA